MIFVPEIANLRVVDEKHKLYALSDLRRATSKCFKVM
jgi:hypothetical protein